MGDPNIPLMQYEGYSAQSCSSKPRYAIVDLGEDDDKIDELCKLLESLPDLPKVSFVHSLDEAVNFQNLPSLSEPNVAFAEPSNIADALHNLIHHPSCTNESSSNDDFTKEYLKQNIATFQSMPDASSTSSPSQSERFESYGNNTQDDDFLDIVSLDSCIAATPAQEIIIPEIDSNGCTICKICGTRIMTTRLSNLRNHSRRHSRQRPYSCPVEKCNYAHTQINELRRHMRNTKCQQQMTPDMLNIVDNYTNSNEVKNEWDNLFLLCFPGFQTPATINWLKDIHYCTECHSPCTPSQMEFHIRDSHAQECIVFCCGGCPFKNICESNVGLHIEMSHKNSNVATIPKPLREDSPFALFGLFKHAFFPTSAGTELPKKPNVNGVSTSKCQLCGRVLNSGIGNALAHAKRHHFVKQYECSSCSFTHYYLGTVSKHIKTKHQGSGVINRKSVTAQDTWSQLVKKCFPNLGAVIDSCEEEKEKLRTKNLQELGCNDDSDPPPKIPKLNRFDEQESLVDVEQIE